MSKVGDDLVEAFTEMAAYLRGDGGAQGYEVPEDVLTPSRIRAIRTSVATSTKVFERQFRIPARTIEAYEQGRRRPDAATTLLLKVIEREPDAVRRVVALAGSRDAGSRR